MISLSSQLLLSSRKLKEKSNYQDQKLLILDMANIKRIRRHLRVDNKIPKEINDYDDDHLKKRKAQKRWLFSDLNIKTIIRNNCEKKELQNLIKKKTITLIIQ